VSEPADENDPKPPPDQQKTVIRPRRPDRGTTERLPPADTEATEIYPGQAPGGWERGEDDPNRTEIWDSAEHTEKVSSGSTASAARSTEMSAPTGARAQTTIRIGDCLNHIYEVKRFIARGGMGEVFEGVNVTSDERVAIKVMLPSLAADPNVIAMFRREARSMTRLQHEALVQYRVLAQEPQLGILYIVTDYIDGVPLCDVLGTLKPTPDQLEMLLRRLASGLRVAHDLGVLHRDISPDNVLLEGGRIERSKIVDFGIAKDLTPGSGTIVGEGFAGKLGYVAPEQLGDYNRDLGPWTDVYSLGLVMAAAAVGHDLGMGGTLVDAVDRRRKGPDLSHVPETLRPVLAAMLRPNPAERLRSMDDVIAMLDARGAPPKAPPSFGEPPSTRVPRAAIFGGAGAAILLLGGLTLWMTSGGPEKKAPAQSTQAQSQAGGTAAGQPSIPVVPRDPLDVARAAINSTIPSIPCSWLNVVRVTGDSRQLNLVINGVAGDPSEAQSEVVSALNRAGLPNADIDASAIARIEPGSCSALDAYRQIPHPDIPRLSTKQLVWHATTKAIGTRYNGKIVAKPVIRFSTQDSRTDLTLFGIDPSGVISRIFDSRAELEQAIASGQSAVTKTGPDSYELTLYADHLGWSGLVLITGKGPFPADIVRPELGARNAAWRDRFATAAERQGWNADMLWFNIENQLGGSRAESQPTGE
jgi:eukaryotic-like serine/threonine-protein kinase